MTVIDVHTHMLTLDWIELLKQHGGVYDVKPTKAGQNSIWKDGAPFMTLMPGMWDYDLRIKAMDKAKVDVAIVSLTCPNCFFGDRATSLKAAQIVNDSMAEQQRARRRPHPLDGLGSLAVSRRREVRACARREEWRGRRHATRQRGRRGVDR